MDRPISLDETDDVHLKRLQALAKIASISHRGTMKFKRNPNLSHVVHASLNIAQAIIALMILLFHHIHHHVNRQLQKDDPSIPTIPEEWNPIFGIYTLCSVVSFVFAGFWLWSNYFMKKPKVIVSCFVLAALLLVVGIVEMKHADWYLNLAEISDAELLVHPIFIHNFIMCLISILCMCLYLLQGWILMDYYKWITREEDSGAVTRGEQRRRVRESPRNLDVPVEKEPVIFYCCLVDLWDYIKFKKEMSKPLHEFQVIHVM